MAEPGRQVPIVLSPEIGLPGFRRNACLKLENDAIVATDGRGRSRHFPLDGSEGAPAMVWAFDTGKEGLLDRTGNLMAIWDGGVFGGQPIAQLCIAADLKWGTGDRGAVPRLRPDGIKIVGFPALKLASACSSIGIVAYAAHQLEIAPAAMTWPIMIVALAVAVVSLVLWKIASRLDPEVAERKGRTIAEALAEESDDDL